MAVTYNILRIILAAAALLVSGSAADPVPGFLGSWELMPGNPGISAMHTVLLPNVDELVIFDATVWQISRLPLPDYKRPCPMHKNRATNKTSIDCWSHSVFYNVHTLKVTPLKVVSDTWCSSGGLDVNGNLISTGGYLDGSRTVRYLWGCPTCDWTEYPTALKDGRWYATQAMMGDGSFVVFGGRESFSYEYIPAERTDNTESFPFPFLQETHDVLRLPGQEEFRLENNLYPFVYLVPDGNLYVFANDRSILFDPKGNRVLREYPKLLGGPRNYPGTATSVLLPLKLTRNWSPVEAEVLICGGSVRDAYYLGERVKRLEPALDDCARMVITSPNPVWKVEKMPTPRVMSDGVMLPTGDVLMINGAELGSAGWKDADKPCFKPLLYKPKAPEGQRFTELAPTNIPRMYHSVANLLPDGRVFVGGSNDNDGYVEWAKFPTELRIEKFSPPYLAPELAAQRPTILVEESQKSAPYGGWFSLKFRSPEAIIFENELMVTMIAPPFVTHSISMNQRLVELPVIEIRSNVAPGVHELVLSAPFSGNIAPPGYYMLSVVYKGIPSPSMWFHVQ